MQKILFLLPSFQLGGTNSSLNNFLVKIDKERFSVDVFAFDDKGPNRAIVAKYANIIGENIWGHPVNKKTKLSIKDIVRSVKRQLMKLNIDISSFAFKRVANQLSLKNYDFVIAFQEGQTTKFLTYFRNTFKIAWIHCDYQSHVSINKIKPEKGVYSKIDRIVCVSEYTQKMFLEVLPDMKDKTLYLHNAMDIDLITAKSKGVIDGVFADHGDFWKIVSIGRLDPVKRFDMIPRFAASLTNIGICLKWLIIGGGSEEYRKKIECAIKENGVEDAVFCIGAMPNPYPYLRSADMIVITSSSEACPMVLNEAKILKIPVVTTDYGSAYEFIENKKNGIICSIEDIPHMMKMLMTDSNLYGNIKKSLTNFKYPNDVIIEKLENEILKK